MTDDNDNMKGVKARRSPRVFSRVASQQAHPKSAGVETDTKSSHRVFEEDFLLLIVIVRALAFILWTGGVLYSTYQVYLAAEEWLPFHRDPFLNPGPFTEMLNRGRDTTDFEWMTFTTVLFSRLIFWYAGYIITTRVCSAFDYQKVLPWISPIMSFTLLWKLTGLTSTLYLFLMPVIYWILVRCRSKLLVWTVTIMFLFSLSSQLLRTLVENNWTGDEDEVIMAEYYFVVTAAWNYARCISFCFDNWNKPVGQTNTVESLVTFWEYVFYLPLMVTGPLVLFEQFEKQILQKESSKSRYKMSWNEDVVKLLKGL